VAPRNESPMTLWIAISAGRERDGGKQKDTQAGWQAQEMVACDGVESQKACGLTGTESGPVGHASGLSEGAVRARHIVVVATDDHRGGEAALTHGPVEGQQSPTLSSRWMIPRSRAPL
jgi:hypothetical protein